MIDFFDEDFPLTKKQEEDMLLKAAEKEKELAAAEEAENKTAENSDSDGEALSVSADESDIESGNCSEASEEEIVSEEKTVSEDPKAFAENETDDNEIKSEENGDNNTAEAEIAEPETNEAPLDSGKAESRGETDAEIAADDFSEEPSPAKAPAQKDGASIEDIDAALHAELKSLVEKLDDMERAVDTMEFSRSEESDGEDFSYEYDDRYFAEEETPAYKYPELYKKTAEPVRKNSAGKQSGITINTKTLIKVGAIVAATAAAVKLLGQKDD